MKGVVLSALCIVLFLFGIAYLSVHRTDIFSEKISNRKSEENKIDIKENSLPGQKEAPLSIVVDTLNKEKKLGLQEIEEFLQSMTGAQLERMDQHFPEAGLIEMLLIKHYVSNTKISNRSRCSAINIIAKIGTENSIPYLLNIIDKKKVELEKNKELQDCASYALGKIAPRDIKQHFSNRFLVSNNPQVLRNAINIIGHTEDTRVIKKMLSLLVHQDELLRCDVIYALNTRNIRNIFPLFTSMLRDDKMSVFVKSCLARTLYSIDPVKSVPELVMQLRYAQEYPMFHSLINSIFAYGEKTDAKVVNAILDMRLNILTQIKKQHPADDGNILTYWTTILNLLIENIKLHRLEAITNYLHKEKYMFYYTGEQYKEKQIVNIVNALDALSAFESRDELLIVLPQLLHDKNFSIQQKAENLSKRYMIMKDNTTSTQ